MLHGNQDDRKRPFCWSSIFLYDQNSAGALEHRPHAHTHIYALGTRDSPLQRLRCAHKENGRRKQIRRGARCIFRGTGSTSEGPLISPNAAKLNTRWKWRHAPHVAESTFIHTLTSFGCVSWPQLCRQKVLTKHFIKRTKTRTRTLFRATVCRNPPAATWDPCRHMKLLLGASQAGDEKPSPRSRHCLIASCWQYWKLAPHCSVLSTCTKLQLKAQHGSWVHASRDKPWILFDAKLWPKNKPDQLNSSSSFFLVTTYNWRLFKQPWRCVVDKLSSLTRPWLRARCSRGLQI